MKEKTSIEELLYGDTQGKKTFSQYRKEKEILDEKTKGSEKTKSGDNTTRDKLTERMDDLHQTRQRSKKVQNSETTQNLGLDLTDWCRTRPR
mgnify:CR=1 FL=1